MTETARLRLPEIAAAQAQKHVTHNEALTFLDTLVQAAVLDKDLTAPPGAPTEGDCYIVAGGGGTATGAWTSWEKRIARFQDGAWISFLPGQGSGIGWTCWVQDESTPYTFDGTNWVKRSRETLTAARTYYVRTDGSDSNNGLANTSGGAFLTLQKAFNVICTLDLNGYTVTIQVGDGTYTAGIAFDKPWVGGNIVVQGNAGTPANVVISTTSADCFNVSAPLSGVVTIKDMKLTTATSGYGIVMSAGGLLQFSNLNFGACASYHIRSAAPAAKVSGTASYAISGSAQVHWQTAVGGVIAIASGITITLSGTPAFSTAFALAVNLSVMTLAGLTFSGSATGVRYSVTQNSVIQTSGGGANYLPGNSAGSTATGGQYV